MSMANSSQQRSTEKGEMPYRTLGKTGEKVSCIGLGGFHLGQSRLEEADAVKLFQTAVDRGINFSDNSWDYNQGESERRVGKALKGRRDKVFVMSKFDGRTKGSALKQLDESLQRLEVDHLDLWQFHENIRLEDPDRFFADGGAHEAMLEARKAGKVRYQIESSHPYPPPESSPCAQTSQPFSPPQQEHSSTPPHRDPQTLSVVQVFPTQPIHEYSDRTSIR